MISGVRASPRDLILFRKSLIIPKGTIAATSVSSSCKKRRRVSGEMAAWMGGSKLRMKRGGFFKVELSYLTRCGFWKLRPKLDALWNHKAFQRAAAVGNNLPL